MLILGPGVVIATSALMNLVLLGSLGSLLRVGKISIAEWFGANSVVAVALPLILLRGKIPNALSVVVASILLALSETVYYAGYAHFLGHRPRRPILLASVMAVRVVVIYWRYVVDNTLTRVFSTTLFSSAFHTALMWVPLRHSSAG